MKPQVGVCFALSLALVGTAAAQKICGEGASEGFLGVDDAGMISMDPMLGGEGTTKACINPKSGKFREIAEGQVTNESGENQTYKNPPEFDFEEPINGKVIYKVKKDGAVKFKASAKIPPELIDDVIAIIEAL